ncbi:FAD-linked sulfhydryl oxidase ALR-like [Planococcus citri]|uniref:FAD-linked sulfhydryl oxidase ALR-like n=1 Tax=Planococcus citri TaxID=170843 RepID=UPI0031F9357A
MEKWNYHELKIQCFIKHCYIFFLKHSNFVFQDHGQDLRKRPLIPINLEEDDVFRKSKRSDCPLNKEELGNRTWSFLHTMAAHFPEKPTPEDQRDMVQFFRILCRFYPCRSCAESFSKLCAERPPEAGSQKELIEWLCWAHNQVNNKLNKPSFDCKLVDDRWKYGWKDGSCE